MDISDKDKATLLICAFRYTLGRKTYMVQLIADLLLQNEAYLAPWMKKQIAEEIDEAIRMNDAGHQCDIDCWLAVRNRFQPKNKEEQR